MLKALLLLASAGQITDIPPPMRRPNRHGGSCVHVSTEMALAWQGHTDFANEWAKTYRGGENGSRLRARLDAAGVRYACTQSGDAEFLEWCTRTRRCATIFYYSSHSVLFCGFHDGHAYLLDNNRIGSYQRIPRESFLRNWRQRYGGFALTPLYDPPPPLPGE